jgi:hypothetical protein
MRLRRDSITHDVVGYAFGAAFLLLAGSLLAEGPDIRAKISAPASLAPGAKGTVVVEMTLGSGWHVNSHTPSEKFLIPTNVTLAASAGTLSAVRYPKDVERRFEFSETPLRVYEGTVRFEADLTLPGNASGKIAVSGAVAYQACDDKQCFAPAKIPLATSVAVSKP